jgi:hypothetical protein
MIIPRRKVKHAAVKETTAAWTWSRARLPKMRTFRTDGMSRSPMFDAVPRRAERFISMLPLRLRMTGTIAINSLTLVIAFQCCHSIRVNEGHENGSTYGYFRKQSPRKQTAHGGEKERW